MMERFEYSSDDFISSTTWNDPEEAWHSNFDKQLIAKWSTAMEKGYFRYQLNIQQDRVIPGDKRFLIQLNPLRLQERRSPQHIDTLHLPYDSNKFNFTKIKPEEILFEMCAKQPSPVENGPTTRKTEQRRHLVIINVSPLEFGHILLVPDIDAGISQRLTLTAVQTSLELLLLSAHPGLRVGFNGLCALASVNHQHVHAWYVNHRLYTEDAPGLMICTGCFETQEIFIRGFILQLAGQTHEQLARKIFSVTSYMQENEIAHNVFFTRGTTLNPGPTDPKLTIRVYIWPRKKYLGAKTENGTPPFFVAVAEMAGHLPCYSEDSYHDISQEEVMNTIKEGSQLSDEEFLHIKQNVIQLLS